MRWWARVLPLCAALVVVAGCDLRPVSEQVSLVDTFAVPTSVEQPAPPPVEDLPEDIPRVVAEPIDDAAAPADVAPIAGNPNEHRSQADRDRAGEPTQSEPASAPTAGATDGSDEVAPGGADDAAATEPDAGPDAPQPGGDPDAAPTADPDDEAGDAAERSAAVPADAGPGEPTVRRSARPEPAEAPTVPLSAIEREIADLLNAERVASGLDPVRVDARLTHGARAWATTMARGGAFTHESEGGFSENIAYGYADAAEVHAAWMSSPGHRDNRMRAGLGAYGIGVRAAGTTLYFVERFQ